MISGKTIAITSGKGGVGKSTVSVNLAYQLSQMGKKTAIIDADIYGFSVPKMFDLDHDLKPKTFNQKIIPIEKFGVQIMSMGFFVDKNEAVVWRGPMLGKMLQHFTKDVLWTDVVYTILDLPPGTGDVALDIHQMLPSCKEILVTTPHSTATHVAERAGSMAVKTNHEIIGVVENMSYLICPDSQMKYHIFGQGGGDYLAKHFNVPLMAEIPVSHPNEDDKIANSIFQSNSEIGSIYSNLAAQVIKATS